MYYKEHLAFTRRNDITFLHECLVGEIKIKRKNCFVTCVYRSPTQTEDETKVFLSGFEQICSSIALESLCCFVIGDLNAKCTNWWQDGINNPCGLELYDMSTILGYSQLIYEPTNFEPNKHPTCIDLIFANQPNLVLESCIHPSLYNTCHHQKIYAKLSLKIHFPPSYKREIWHYSRAQTDLIKNSIELFDWDRAFEDLSVNDQVDLFNNTLLNIFRNFIPYESIKCSDKNPPWMNKDIKGAIRHKNRLYRKYISAGKKREDQNTLQEYTDFVSNLITTKKDFYFVKLGERLNDPTTAPKTYWSILKRFLNKIKIPTIPPLLVDGNFVTDFKKKTGIFNAFFADQCNIFNNGSTIPGISYKTNIRKSDINIFPFAFVQYNQEPETK